MISLKYQLDEHFFFIYRRAQHSFKNIQISLNQDISFTCYCVKGILVLLLIKFCNQWFYEISVRPWINNLYVSMVENKVRSEYETLLQNVITRLI